MNLLKNEKSINIWSFFCHVNYALIKATNFFYTKFLFFNVSPQYLISISTSNILQLSKLIRKLYLVGHVLTSSKKERSYATAAHAF